MDHFVPLCGCYWLLAHRATILSSFPNRHDFPFVAMLVQLPYSSGSKLSSLSDLNTSSCKPQPALHNLHSDMDQGFQVSQRSRTHGFFFLFPVYQEPFWWPLRQTHTERLRVPVRDLTFKNLCSIASSVERTTSPSLSHRTKPLVLQATIAADVDVILAEIGERRVIAKV